MNAQKIKVFTHCCIEGHVCAALLKSSFKCEVKYETCTPNNFIEHLSAFLKKEEIKGEKSFIFITDLNIAESQKDKPEVQELLDKLENRGNVVLLDHHVKASWLASDGRIKAYVDPSKKSASHMVLDTLKSNVLGKEERKEKGLDGYPQFPPELMLNLNTDYNKLNNFNSTIDVIDDIDSGKTGHEDILYVFHSSRSKFVERIEADYSVVLSDEQRKQFKAYEAEKTKRIKAFMKKAVDGKSRIAKIVKGADGLTYAKVICPESRDTVDPNACDVAKAFSSLNLKYDCLEVFRVKKNEVAVSVFAKGENVDASKLASQYGGGGHEGAAGYTTTLESVGITNNNGVYNFVEESMDIFKSVDPENRIKLPRFIKDKEPDIAFAL